MLLGGAGAMRSQRHGRPVEVGRNFTGKIVCASNLSNSRTSSQIDRVGRWNPSHGRPRQTAPFVRGLSHALTWRPGGLARAPFPVDGPDPDVVSPRAEHVDVHRSDRRVEPAAVGAFSPHDEGQRLR